MNDWIKDLYIILLKLDGKVIDVQKIGDNHFLVTTERTVYGDDMSTGLVYPEQHRERMVLMPKKNGEVKLNE